ncbi:ABC transporter permease [Sessilibacter corallicola]|uniref:ABC transporter permease n=1 Tax=Sessilibacter corallicola TaxID=2904075 RepID=UPI0033412A73
MINKYLQLIWLRAIGALKADAQNSYLGSLWWILEPLLLASLMYIAFSTGIRGSKETGASFFLFLITGLIPLKWTLSCLQTGSNSLLNNKGFIGQVYIPKWVFPATVNLSQSIRFLFAIGILIVFLLFLEIPIGNISIPSLIFIICIHMSLNFGISTWLAASVPLVPDLTHLIPLISMTLMFTSGVFFDISSRPESIQAILNFNPMIPILDGYRGILLEQESISPTAFQYPILIALISTSAGLFQIQKLSKYYPRILQ